MDKKILIVDDEEEVVAFLARFLKRFGINSETSLSGEDALLRCQKENFDCILLDLNLGGISGIDVLQKLKEQNKKFKVIIITGSINENDKIKAFELGVIDFIQKPVELSELKDKVLKIL